MSHRTELILLLAIVLMIGCSGSHSPISVLPFDPQSSAQGNLSPSTHSSNHYLWGYYLFHWNPECGEIEVIPAREIAVHFNALKWLEQVPCTNCVEIVSISPDPSGTKNVQIRIRHPFSTANLTGFDVRGILMFNGSHTFPVSGLTTPDKSAGDGELVNADGYTTLYNITTEGSGPGGIQGYMQGRFATDTPPSATLNGYKRHGTYTPANTRNAFYAGDKSAEWYEIMLPSTALVLGYAVDASWVAPTVNPVTDPMTDFPPSANCPEPWKIDTDLTPIGIGLNDEGGEVKLTVDVFDYQGKDSHDPPMVECPELFDGTKTATWTSDGSGFSKWEIVVGNEKLAPAGDYKCPVKVVDGANADSPWYLDLTAYQIATLTVAPWANVPPVAMANAYPNLQMMGQPVQFEDDGSYDPDGGSIVKYEWDWDNNGVYDDEGASVSHTWESPGEYYVQLRVTDDEGSTGTLDIPLAVSIGNFAWAKSAGGTASSEGAGVAALSDGSTIVTGAFDEWATFGAEEPNEVMLTSGKDQWDIFVARYGPDGMLAWAKHAGGAGDDRGYAIATLSDDSVVVAGYFVGSAKFNPGEPDEVTLTSQGSIDIFVARYNPDGTLVWAKNAGGIGWAVGCAITALPDDSVAVTGYFTESATFGKGEPAETTLVSVGYDEIFVARYNPDGSLAWAKSAGGSKWDDGTGIASLSDNSIVVCGEFGGSATFGTGEPNEVTLTALGYKDIFITRHNPDGTLVWARRVGDVSKVSNASGVASLSDNSFVVAGHFNDSVTFGDGEPNEVTFHSVGSDDIFTARYNSDGTLAWAKSTGGTHPDEAYGITSLSDDSVAITGTFCVSATFGQGEPNWVTLTSAGHHDIFVARYNPDGTLAWAKSAGGLEVDEGRAVTALSDDSVVVTGLFGGSATFGKGEPTETTLQSAGDSDIFVARFCD